ncbi:MULTISPECIES: HEPN domain-containing protein [Stenotrophomonas maltophilia group]|uniref:HEPN domain-containing protein n=1 Tax=Stenotrophomonas maltophilia group TaxID=995085 RepID=UPI0018D2840F|nr:hypothetical protein [Stenotrophomonas maltophilia]HDS1301042.1 hypothetical protein [Stenotrophomonas maltophilia]
MPDLDMVLAEFTSDVERVEHLLTLIRGFKDFGGSVPPAVGEGEPPVWVEAAQLHQTASGRRTDLPVLSGSLQLYLAGRFEYCIRQIVEAVADEICTRVEKYADLPKSLQAELRSRVLDVAKAPKKYGYDDLEAEALLESYVASRAITSPPVSISSQVLALTESNMRDRVLSDVLLRVGITEFWANVGKQAPVKLFLEKSTDPEATREAQSRLNNIMDERNQVAHPTGSTNFPDPGQVLKTAKFLTLIARTCTDLAKIYLSSFASR